MIESIKLGRLSRVTKFLLISLCIFAAFVAFGTASGASQTQSGQIGSIDSTRLIEVFTAENCEICRDAESYLARRLKGENVVVIAYHLNYWNYLGIADPFADPVFGARQIGYNQSQQLKELSTPQAFFQGMKEFNPNDQAALDALLEMPQSPPVFDVELTRTGNMFDLSVNKKYYLTPTKRLGRQYVILAELFKTEEVKAMQNFEAAVSLPPVRSLQELANWDGKTDLNIRFKLESGRDAVLFLQDGDFGKIQYVAKLSIE